MYAWETLKWKLSRRVKRRRFAESLIQYLAIHEVQVVLDVGANCGQYGRFLRTIGYRGRIISFEPVRSSFEELSVMADRDPHWTALQCALGEAPGEFPIHVHERTDFSSFRPVSSFGRAEYSGIANPRSEMVAVQRLDDVLPDLGLDPERPAFFLKTDTQGFDLEVLRGASGVLDGCIGLQCEIAVTPIYEGIPPLTEALLQYQQMGFVPIALQPFSWQGGRVVEMDVLLAPEDRR